jgi:hypothetical protein
MTVDIGEADPMDFYARLAAAAYYGDDHDAKQEYINEHLTDKNWKVDGELSNMDRTIFYKPKKEGARKNVIMSNRGTDMKNNTGNIGRNAMADASIFFGAEPRHQRFKDANKEFLNMREKYGPESNFAVGGHSLGASQSLYLNRRHNVESHSHNPGASFSHLAKGALTKAMCWWNPNLESCKAADNSTIYHQIGDPVSTASIVSRDKKQYANSDKSKAGWNLHGLSQFFIGNQK